MLKAFLYKFYLLNFNYPNQVYSIRISDIVILKYKNVLSIKKYNIKNRLKYFRIKQSSKKNIKQSRINIKY